MSSARARSHPTNSIMIRLAQIVKVPVFIKEKKKKELHMEKFKEMEPPAMY